MASLAKKGNVYHGRHIYYENGERREKTKTFRTGDQRLAYQRLAEWEKELEASKFGENYSPEFTDASRRWINAKAFVVKPTTITRYETSLKQLNPFFKDKRLGDITPADLERFENKRRRDPGKRLARHGERGTRVLKDNGRQKAKTTKHKRRPTKPRQAKTFAFVTGSSIRRDFACLSALMTYGARQGWCRKDLVSEYVGQDDKRKSLKAVNPRTRYLSHSEQSRLLLSAAGRTQGSEWDRRMSLAAIELSIETGLRKDELLHQLVWPDVQIGRRPEFAVRGKGDKVRRVPLTPRALEIVTALPIPTKRPNDVGHLIICRENGRPYGDMDKALAEACKRAKIPDFTWHDLRRTCGCRLLQDRRFQMVQVRDWMGHESVETTERHYAFLRVEDLHLALERSEDEKAAAPSAEVLPLRRRKT